MTEEIKPVSDEHLPKATHEGQMEIMGVIVRTYVLDDGRAVIHADDFPKLLKLLGLGDE